MDGDEQTTGLLKSVEVKLSKESSPEQDIRDRAARKIRERAATLYRDGHRSSRIEMGMTHADHGKLHPLLKDIAERLSPVISH